MNATLLPLSDAVLPLIRTTNRDLWRYSAANEQGMRMGDGAAILAVAVESPNTLPSLGVRVATPKETYTVVHKALASALKVIGRADDSSGIMGSACRELIRLHPLAAHGAQVPQVKLADWVFQFHFNKDVDFFELDPVAYGPALGDSGLAHLRSLVAGFRVEVTTTPPQNPSSSYDHREFLLNWFERRFAVLDKNFEAIIATHLREGKVAAHYEAVTQAFEEIGETDQAITWAHRALLFDHGHQARTAAQRWWRLLETYRPEELPAAARLLFDRWPDSDSAARLVELAGIELADHVQTALANKPDCLIRFQLNTLAQPRLAWQTAHSFAGRTDWVQVSNSAWAELADAYFAVDPIAALGVQLELVAAPLTVAKTSLYRPAARNLKKLRQAALKVSPEATELVDQAIRGLRESYQRRPSFLAALDRAQLP